MLSQDKKINSEIVLILRALISNAKRTLLDTSASWADTRSDFERWSVRVAFPNGKGVSRTRKIIVKLIIMKKVDYIIVGQGLAGTVLAQTLLSNNKTVLIIDNPNLSNASKVAAGLYNPVVFKRLVKSWMVDDLLPFMDSFYINAEHLLGDQFYHKNEIVKLFTEENEKDFWLKKTKEDVGTYLSKTIQDHFLEDSINAPLGSSETIHAGHLDVNKFLTLFENYFQTINSYSKETFDFKNLIIENDGIVYKNIQANKIIFCEGYKAIENPYFNWLPFKLTKGETLTIKIDADVKIDKIINKGVFILPIGNTLYKVGATYEWKDLTNSPTEKGKNELIEKLDKVLKVPYQIINHQAGIRPTISDRRPLLGLHPQHPQLVIFNGMGTKGVMLAPFFANHFADFLDGKSILNKEVNIKRF